MTAGRGADTHMRRVLIVSLTLAAPARPSRRALALGAAPRGAAASERAREQRAPRQPQRGSRADDAGPSTSAPNGELDVANIAGDIVVTRGGGSSATIEIVKTARGETATRTPGRCSRWCRRRRRARHAAPRSGPAIRARTRCAAATAATSTSTVAFNITAPARHARRRCTRSPATSRARDISGELTLDIDQRQRQHRQRRPHRRGQDDLRQRRAHRHHSRRHARRRHVSGDGARAEESRRGPDAVTGQRQRHARGRRLRARRGQAVSGDVQFSGDLEPNGRYELTSHSGSVRIAVGGKTGFELEATSFSGGIRSDLPLTHAKAAAGRRPRHAARQATATAAPSSTSPPSPARSSSPSADAGDRPARRQPSAFHDKPGLTILAARIRKTRQPAAGTRLAGLAVAGWHDGAVRYIADKPI